MERQDWIDRYKGLLIILVVMGHVVGGACHLTTGASANFLHYCYITIYSFHMPAFFFLAGITWRQREDEKFRFFFIKKAKRLLGPYFIFGILSSIVFCLMSHSFGNSVESQATTTYYTGKNASSFVTCLLGLLHAGGYPNGEGFRMNSVLWFLPCLFSVEMVYWWLRRFRLVKLRVLLVVIFCVALSILSPRFFTELPWGFSKLPWYLLFVILGAECFPARAFPMLERRGWFVNCCIVCMVMAYSVLCCVAPDPIMALRNWLWWPLYATLAVFGCVLFAGVSQIQKGSWWKACGMASMGIMLMHKFFVVFCEIKLPCVRQLFNSGVAGAVVGALVIVGAIVAVCYGITRVILRIAPGVLGERGLRR